MMPELGVDRETVSWEASLSGCGGVSREETALGGEMVAGKQVLQRRNRHVFKVAVRVRENAASPWAWDLSLGRPPEENEAGTGK